MAWGEQIVTVVNPGGPGKAKSMATPKRGKDGKFLKGKGKGGGGKRRRNPSPSTPTPNPRKRKKKGSRRRRRPNPSGGGGRTSNPSFRDTLRRAFDGVIPRMAARFATSWVVRRWGTDWGPGIMGDKKKLTSPYRGEGWGLWNYALAAGTGYFGGRIMDMVRPGWGVQFTESAFDSLIERLIYTEIFGRNKTLQEQFGRDPSMMIGYEDDGMGDRWGLYEGTDYESTLLGIRERTSMGAIEARTAMGALAERSHLGGIERAPPRIGRRYRAAERRGRMGHYSVLKPDPYLAAGYTDPYQAVNSFQGY